MSNSSFINKLPADMKKIWEQEGFKKATSIQEQAFPLIDEGRDIIAQSPTGTGKTLAYLLPLLNKIDAESMQLQTVVLASSRELVMQIHNEIQKWTVGSNIRSASFIGGANIKRQLEKLKKKPHIVVGTPGKIQELIQQKKMKMHEVKTIVLDEVDTLIVPEHFDTVSFIIKSTMKDRQLALFSATVTADIADRMGGLLNDPEYIQVKTDAEFKGKVDHIYFVCEKRDKPFILEKIARLDAGKALVFMKDIGDMEYTSSKLGFKDIEVGVLHADSNKSEREKAIKGFRKGIYPMLLSTDVAARGLDIKGLSMVVHYDLPRTVEQYTHRSGRTGRAGNDGTVISIITPQEERDLKRLAKQLNITAIKKEFFQGRIVDEHPNKQKKKELPKKNSFSNGRKRK